MPPQIEEQRVLPLVKKQKIEGGSAGEEDEGQKGSTGTKSSDEMEASRLEEGDDSEDDSSGESVSEGPPMDPWKIFRNLPEALLSKLMNAPEHNPDIDYIPTGAGRNFKVDWDLWDEYYKQIEETEGFGVKVYPGLCPNAYLAPVPRFKECCGEITELADLAIIEFNKDNPGKEFKVVDVEWVVHQAARGILYYITFTAEDPKEGVKTFEAKVLDGIDEREVELCRLKKQEAAASLKPD